VNLKNYVGLILVKDSTMRVTIPPGFHTSPSFLLVGPSFFTQKEKKRKETKKNGRDKEKKIR
jgi:hypothetical protein